MTKTQDTAETGESLYITVTSVSDLRMLYKTYAGTTEDSLGAPVFDESMLPAGLTTHELYADKDEVLGGLHPFGPETALNAQRLPGRENECPLTAGMVDLHGNLLIGHEEQMHPSKYFNENGDFVLPTFVQEKGAFKIMVNPCQTSIFDADLPHPTCGSEEPDDNILLLFWEEQKTANSILVTARKHAQARGLDSENWQNFREEIFRAIGQQMSERDGLSKELCRAMQQSKLCGKDSFDLTDEERMQARAVSEWCSYEARTLEPFQILKQLSAEINNLYAFIRRWRFERDQHWEEELSKVRDDERQTAEMEASQQADHKRHTQLRRSVIKLALQKMQNAFESHNHRRSIPPGWLAIWDSLQEEIKRAGAEAAKCHEQRPGSMVVDPTDPESSVGSAAVGQLFGNGYNNFDVNSQGMFMELTMQLLNGEQGIQGPSTFITMSMHYAQYQVAQMMSFILAICGEGSTGKSERAALMMETQLQGWWVSGGGKSELADFNGMDDSCGRTVHLDEATKEFTSTGNATEKIKEITMKNSCTRSRTVKKKNASGDEKWETEVTFTLHYECYVITTNCGFCLQHGNEEPSDSRAPLFDRMITFPAPPVANVTAASKEAVHQKRHTIRGVKTLDRIIQYRIICGLTWTVLLLIKHIPDFHPANADWAQRIMDDMDDTLMESVPNVQRSTPRKQQLRNMTLMAICVQKEVVRKFFTVEGCLQHDDLQPRDGYLPPWNITQLVDVIQRLNYSPADVFEAWSHSLDYNPSTSSVSFHVRQMVAMSHGVAMDDRSPKRGTADPVTQEEMEAARKQGRTAKPYEPAESVLYPQSESEPAAAPGGAGPSGLQSAAQIAAAQRRNADFAAARDWANNAIGGISVYSPMSEAISLTYDDASRRQREMSRSRQLMCFAMKTRRDVHHDSHVGDVIGSLGNLLKTGDEKLRVAHGTSDDESVFVPVTKVGDLQTMDTDKAAGCLLPTLNDVLCCGYEHTMLLKWLRGLSIDKAGSNLMSTGTSTAMLDRRLGICKDETSWSYVCIKRDSTEATAAQFNTMWRVIKSSDGGATPEGSGWREAARSITKGGSDACNVGKYGLNLGITDSNLRDALWLLSTCKNTLIGKDSRRVFADVGQPNVADSVPECTAAYGAMRGELAQGVPTWNRAPPVVHTEATNGGSVRPFGAEMWNSTRPAVDASLQFVAPKPLDEYGRVEELAVRRFQKLFQVGALPACNPFAMGAVETGAMIRMDRSEMHVNSLSIIQHMRLFMEIAYCLATQSETRNKSGVSAPMMPSVLMRDNGKSKAAVQTHKDTATANKTPQAERGLRQNLQASAYHGGATDPTVQSAAVAYIDLQTQQGSDDARGDPEEEVEDEMDGEGAAEGAEDEMDVDEAADGEAGRVENLGFGFEMFTLWATITMAGRWSNDCDEHVKGIVHGREHIFESAEQVLNQLPKLTTKFCSFKELVMPDGASDRVSDDDFSHRPISIALSRSSTYAKALPSIKHFNSRAILNIRKDYERFMQREVNDVAMYEELNLKLKSIGGIPGVHGNLWSRSTWELASRKDMIARGQAHGGPDDMDLFHVRDSDLDIRLRMVALLAKHNPTDPVLQRIVGSRKNAEYQTNRAPTIPEWNRARRERKAMMANFERESKKQKRGRFESYRATPMPMTAFSSRLEPRQERRQEPMQEGDEGGEEFDAMEHDIPPQQGA
jgi:hypothetical protein